jgi:hypothetical protein
MSANLWILRQNYAEITNQKDMRELIINQKFVTCPWGGWGEPKQNVMNHKYNEKFPEKSSRGQDRKFVEDMEIGDIVLIPFAKRRECIIVRICSNVEYEIETGLFWNQQGNQIKIGSEGQPFKPVGRRIEILNEKFIPGIGLGQWTLSKMNKTLVDKINILL